MSADDTRRGAGSEALDGQIASLLRHEPDVELPADPADTVRTLRADHERKAREFTPPANRDVVGTLSTLNLPTSEGLPARLYLPADGEPQGTVVWAHGGGWVTGSLETADIVARALCARAGVAVLSLDYRLAPEDPWPAGLTDMVEATQWALAEVSASRLPGPVIVGGDSAGGNLAALVAARPELSPQLAGQLLIYPGIALDSGPDVFASRTECGIGYGLDESAINVAASIYVTDPDNLSHPEVSPLRASSVAATPPAVVLTCGFDPLRDEGNAYALRLSEEGVPVTLLEEPTLVHGALDMIGASRAADKAMTRVAAVVVDILSGRAI